MELASRTSSIPAEAEGSRRCESRARDARRIFSSIRFRLVLLITLALAALAGVTVYYGLQHQSDVEERATSNAVGASQLIAQSRNEGHAGTETFSQLLQSCQRCAEPRRSRNRTRRAAPATRSSERHRVVCGTGQLRPVRSGGNSHLLVDDLGTKHSQRRNRSSTASTFRPPARPRSSPLAKSSQQANVERTFHDIRSADSRLVGRRVGRDTHRHVTWRVASAGRAAQRAGRKRIFSGR